MTWQETARDTKINQTLPYPEKIPPHIESNLPQSSALQKQFVYSEDEVNTPGGLEDPIGDGLKAKGSGIIHRYKNRILYTPTQACPVNCRYCFRKNELNHGHKYLSPKLSALKEYLGTTPEVEEVILTGGDPLILSDNKLADIFQVCADAKIKYLRIHTRTPIAIPERIDEGFLALIKKFESRFERIFFVLHTNHIDELTEEVRASLMKLQLTRMSLLTQSVLLKGVNDCALDLKNLMETLVSLGFSPYYLHHPDKVKGAMHFYLSEEEGMQIYKELRKISSGWAVPHYIVDSPLALGKKLVINQLI